MPDRHRASLAFCIAMFLIGAALTWYAVFMWAGATAKCPPGKVCNLPVVAVFAMGIAAAPLGGAILAWYPCKLYKRYRQQVAANGGSNGSSSGGRTRSRRTEG